MQLIEILRRPKQSNKIQGTNKQEIIEIFFIKKLLFFIEHFFLNIC